MSTHRHRPSQQSHIDDQHPLPSYHRSNVNYSQSRSSNYRRLDAWRPYFQSDSGQRPPPFRPSSSITPPVQRWQHNRRTNYQSLRGNSYLVAEVIPHQTQTYYQSNSGQQHQQTQPYYPSARRSSYPAAEAIHLQTQPFYQSNSGRHHPRTNYQSSGRSSYPVSESIPQQTQPYYQSNHYPQRDRQSSGVIDHQRQRYYHSNSGEQHRQSQPYYQSNSGQQRRRTNYQGSSYPAAEAIPQHTQHYHSGRNHQSQLYYQSDSGQQHPHMNYLLFRGYYEAAEDNGYGLDWSCVQEPTGELIDDSYVFSDTDALISSMLDQINFDSDDEPNYFLDDDTNSSFDIDFLISHLEDGHVDNLTSHLSEDVITKYLETKTYRVNPTETSEICAICHCEYEEQENVSALGCGHEYHLDCIKKWLLRKNDCPMCRETVLPLPITTTDQITETLPFSSFF